jgi:hypothetical protein
VFVAKTIEMGQVNFAMLESETNDTVIPLMTKSIENL